MECITDFSPFLSTQRDSFGTEKHKMAAEFSVDAVKECILARGGRIRNHELVTYFKKFLNDPADKGSYFLYEVEKGFSRG